MEKLDMLKKLKNQIKDTQKLSDAFEALDKSKKKELDDFWKPKMGPDEVGEAIVRFLPAAEGEAIPFVRVYWHSFQSPKNKKWYVEKCRSTLGNGEQGKDPCNEYNLSHWDKGEEYQKLIQKYTKRQTRFYSNVLVLKDDVNPENVGQVRVYQFGQKIYEKIAEALNPTHDDEPVNVFDPWKGANFKIRIKKVKGWVNYDDSVFTKPESLGSDEYIEEIWKQCQPLQPLTDPKSFKSYEELKEKFLDVMGHNKPKTVEIPESESADYESSKTKEVKTTGTAEATELPTASSKDEESVESFFENLQTAKG